MAYPTHEEHWAHPPAWLQRGHLHQGPRLSEHDMLAQVRAYCSKAGYEISPLLILDYWISIKVRPFVILFGPSGLGKTELARIFAQALVEPFDDQYTYVNVGLGSELDSFLSLQDRFGWMKFLEVLETAGTRSNSGRVYFLCLDNLRASDIETYFSLLVQNPDEEFHRLALRGARPQNWPIVPANVILTGTIDTEHTSSIAQSIIGRASSVFVQPQWLVGTTYTIRTPVGYQPVGYQRLIFQAPIRSDALATARLQELLDDVESALTLPADLQSIMWQTGLTYDQAWRSATIRFIANSYALDGRGLFAPNDILLNAQFALTWELARQMILRLSAHPNHIKRLEAIVQEQLDALPEIRWI